MRRDVRFAMPLKNVRDIGEQFLDFWRNVSNRRVMLAVEQRYVAQ